MTLEDSPERLAARERVIVALDFPTAHKTFEFLHRVTSGVPRDSQPLWLKIGLELYLAEGAQLVHRLRAAGYSIFLDLKLYDIPNTVGAAVRSMLTLEPALLTVHASGGAAMLRAAAEAAAGSSTRLLAVTVLTSMSAPDLTAAGISASPEEQVERLALLAASAGIRSFVSSPAEAPRLLTAVPGAYLVTPGIRPAFSLADDQQRISTPAAAIRAGASQLVIGRPITAAPDPATAWLAILNGVGEAAGRK